MELKRAKKSEQYRFAPIDPAERESITRELATLERREKTIVTERLLIKERRKLLLGKLESMET